MKNDLISLKNLSGDEILELVQITAKIKDNKTGSPELLHGKSIGLVFQKPSNRTRVSFDVGINQLGGNSVYLGPDEINLGVRESVADVSQTLSRFLDGIVARVHRNEDVVALAKYSSVPVINGLCDLYHPCQGLTDLFSIYEKFGGFDGVTTAYIGDGNNVCHSLMIGLAKIGANINIATPQGYEPDKDIVKSVHKIAEKSGAKINISHDPKAAVKGAKVIYTDTWISMGQEAESDSRIAQFEGFQVNKDLVKHADKNFIFMHCLPAHRGQEVTEDIIDGEHSIIFDQAENRLHSQKAILIHLFEKQKT